VVNPDLRMIGLDHVAITVKQLEVSVAWYHRVLKLEPMDFPEWGNRPFMLRGGSSMIALFESARQDAWDTEHMHFAFYVESRSFEAFREHFSALPEPFTAEIHHPYQSLYLRDPDGYKVEITTRT